MNPRRVSTRPMSGYTLVELVITIAIVAILATIALPSFARVIASNSVVSGVNEFIAAVNLARMEAVRRGSRTGICASDNGSTCGTDWDAGYMVYAASSGTPAVITPLRAGKMSSRNTLTGSANDIKFTSRGLRDGSDAALSYKPKDENYVDQLQRCLIVSATGFVTSKEGGCS